MKLSGQLTPSRTTGLLCCPSSSCVFFRCKPSHGTKSAENCEICKQVAKAKECCKQNRYVVRKTLIYDLCEVIVWTEFHKWRLSVNYTILLPSSPPLSPSLFGGGSMINSISEAEALLMLSPENQIKCTGKRAKHRRQQQPVVSAHHHHPQYYFFQPTSPQGSGTQFNCGTTVTNGGFIYDHQTVVPSNPSPLSPPSLSPSAAAHIPQTLWYANCFLNGQYYGNDYQMLGQNVDDVSRNQHNSAEEEDDMVEEGTAEEVVPGRGEECYGGEAVAEESEKISLFNKHEEPCSEKEFLDELAVHSGEEA